MLLISIATGFLFDFGNSNTISTNTPAYFPAKTSDTLSHMFQSWACVVHILPNYAGQIHVHQPRRIEHNRDIRSVTKDDFAGYSGYVNSAEVSYLPASGANLVSEV